MQPDLSDIFFLNGAVEDGFNHIGAASPHILFGNNAGFDTAEDLFLEASAAGHDEVIARCHSQRVAGLTFVGRIPVGHHDTVKAPFIAQQLGTKIVAVGRIDAIDPIVGGHDANMTESEMLNQLYMDFHVIQKNILDLADKVLFSNNE